MQYIYYVLWTHSYNTIKETSFKFNTTTKIYTINLWYKHDYSDALTNICI